MMFISMLAVLADPAWGATVARWTFDDDGHSAGDVITTVVDDQSAASGAIGTGGAVYSSDVPTDGTGLSLAFDGDDAIVFANESVFDRDWNQPFTAELYVKTSGTSGHANLLVKLLPAAPFRGFQWVIDYSTGFQQVAMQNNNSPHRSAGVLGSTPVNDGAWHHLAVVYDGSGTAAGFTLYVDQAAEATTTQADTLGGNTTLNDEVMRLGRDPRNINGFVGNIDQVRFSDAALTPAEFDVFTAPVATVPVLPPVGLALLGGLFAAAGAAGARRREHE